MTAQELFNLTVGITGSTPSQAQSNLPTYLPILNTILSQTLKCENNNREYLALTPLTSSQVITGLSDVLTYQDYILRNVVVWGVAQLFALNDDDTIKSGFYETRFADGLNSNNHGIPTDIVDYYSLESEE